MKSLVKIVECCIETMQRMLKMYHKNGVYLKSLSKLVHIDFVGRIFHGHRHPGSANCNKFRSIDLFWGLNLQKRGQNHSAFVVVVVVVVVL